MICGLLIALLCPPIASAEPLEVGALHFPPFCVVENILKPTGSLVDIFSKVLERAGIDFYIVGYPPRRLYHNIATGRTNIWVGTLGVAAYEAKTIHSSFSFMQIDLRAYAMGDQMLPKSFADLKKGSIITIFGYDYGGYINFLENPQHGIQLLKAKSREAAYGKLTSGRFDYLLDYARPAQDYFKDHPVPGVQSQSLALIDLYMIISKQTPDAGGLMARMETAYLELKNAGEINLENKNDH